MIGGPDAMGNAAIDGLFLDDFWSNFAYRLPWSGPSSPFAHSLPVHSSHVRRDRVAPLPPCRLPQHSGQAEP